MLITPDITDKDISPKNLTEVLLRKELLENGILQDAILDSAHFAMIATDAKGIIQIFNAGAEHMLGYLASEVINKISPSDMHDIQEIKTRARTLSLELATAISPGFEALAIKAARGNADNYELTYICKDGSRFPARISISALRSNSRSNNDNDIIGYLLISIDNSAHRQVEYELNKAQSMSRQDMLANNDFLSNISYKLRTPLSSILGFTQLMQTSTPPPTPGQQSNLEQILESGWKLLEMIKEIPDLMPAQYQNVLLPVASLTPAEVMQEYMPLAATSMPVLVDAVSNDAFSRTLLYVEDNPVNMILIEDTLLRRPDIRLLTATNAIRGIEIARASQPDVILMDINLPGINGIQALRMLADDLSTAHIPVVALSASATSTDIKKGMQAGFFRYLTKPLILTEFMTTLDMALEFTQKEKALKKRES